MTKITRENKGIEVVEYGELKKWEDKNRHFTRG